MSLNKLLEIIVHNSDYILEGLSYLTKEARRAKQISVLNTKNLTLGLTFNEKKRLNALKNLYYERIN